MLNSDFEYLLNLFTNHGSSLGQYRIDPDWVPALEWTRFLAIRQGRIPAALPGRAESIIPIWNKKLGEPYLQEFQASIGVVDAEPCVASFSTTYFEDIARKISTELVAKGRLREGDKFRYLTAAVAKKVEARKGAISFTLEEIDPPIRVRDTSLDRFAARAVKAGTHNIQDMPVFIPHHVLHEARMLSQAAEGKETGGLLIGFLHRDAAVPEAFVEVTAQIPVQHVVSDATRLTFTPETWTAAQTAMDQRRRNESMIGWWHAHPVKEWCKDCSSAKRHDCLLGGDFFSDHDRKLHRVMFPSAFSVALVVNDTGAAPSTFSLFGWRRGTITLRGFQTLDLPNLQCTVAGRAQEANMEDQNVT